MEQEIQVISKFDKLCSAQGVYPLIIMVVEEQKKIFSFNLGVLLFKWILSC